MSAVPTPVVVSSWPTVIDTSVSGSACTMKTRPVDGFSACAAAVARATGSVAKAADVVRAVARTAAPVNPQRNE
jgi:hypothetical protein